MEENHNLITEFQKFDDYQYWFVYHNFNTWSVVDRATNEVIGYVQNDSFVDASSHPLDRIFPNNIISDWEQYKLRKEYMVGQKIHLDGVLAETAKSHYIELISGIICCRAYRANNNPDLCNDYIGKVLTWLESGDFYTAPASTIYHESFPHGLLYHTLSVYNNMVDLYQVPKFCASIDIDSAALCCLAHDWCKIGLYQSYKRNIKNEETGQWERVDAYKRGAFPHTFGHGVTSMYMAMKLFKLTEDEALAIRWHMSMFNVSNNEVNEYQQACEQYPLVHLLQFADQLSIVDY